MPYKGPWVTPAPVTVTGRPVMVLPVGLTASDTAGSTAALGGVGLEWSTDTFPGSPDAHTVSELHWWVDFTPLIPVDATVTLTPQQVAAGVSYEYDPDDTDRMTWVSTSSVNFTVLAHAVTGPTLTPPNTVLVLSDEVRAYAHPRTAVESLGGAVVPPWVGPADVTSLTPVNVGLAPLDLADEPFTFTVPTATISHPDASSTPGPLALVSFLVHFHAAGFDFPLGGPADGWEHWTGLRTTIGGLDLVSGQELLPAVSWTYQPRRWRLVYATTPPLRQHPRDDFLGGTPRQGHVNQPQSTQASARQGWANTYR